MQNEKAYFRAFFFTLETVFFACSEQRRARTELYEAPGGYPVDGLPPDPSNTAKVRLHRHV
eukprot:3486050-Pyramimonas_sp.AAC.1